MAAIVLTDAQCYVGSYDFTGDSNTLEVEASVNVVDANVFGSDWAKRLPGVRTTAFNMSGFFQAGSSPAATVDSVEFAALGTANRVVTFAPGSSTEGDPCYLFRTVTGQYSFLGAHGDVAPFSVSAQGSDGQGLVRGYLAKKLGDVTSTGAIGTGVQITGGVASGEYLYASLHIFSAGTTITVDVESDDNAGFTTPTSRGTIGPLTTTGGTWLTRVAGPITDDYYRFNVTAITGTFSVAGAIGIR